MGSEKDMGNRHDVVSDNATRSPFSVGNGVFPSELSDRASKLVSALYLVTSLMPEGDPVRTELRNVGVALVSDIAKSTGGVRGSAALVSVIVSLLDLSKNAGVMSAMNAEMLSEKFIEFSHGIAADGNGAIGRSALALLSDSFSNSVKDASVPSVSATHKGQRVALLARSAQSAQRPHAGKGDSSRRAKIIDFIKDKKRVGIKEISRIFPGLSEKTVQRELLDLVKARVLAKEGERRWSVYTIA